MNERGVGAAGSRTAPDIHENQEALSVAKRGKLCVETRRAARAQMVRVTNMNDDDSGDEAEARHLLEKRRTQAKYDAVRSESDKSVVETVAEPGLMDSLLRCLITPPQPIDRRRSTMASAGVPDRMVEPSP